MGADPAGGRKIILIVEYDGRRYRGSQYQKNAPTIQGEIEKAVAKLTGETQRVKAASRTDTGVHARGQVFSFITDTALPLQSYVEGMNHFLPDDIAVKAAYEADVNFDVRRRAVSREYRYYLYRSPGRLPLRDGRACRVYGDVDVDAMNRACKALIGRHDFASFVASAGTAREKATEREILQAEITQDGDTIVLKMVARSFLPHQVRTTVGALLQVGQGKMTVEEFAAMVAAATPGMAGPMVPPDGLYLEKVNYPSPFKGEAR